MARTLLGRYRLIAAIGQGGMGSVQLAEDRRLPGRQCALKAHRPPAAQTPAEARTDLDRFAQEARLLAQLDHPALPKVSDHFEHDGVGYLVMDYVPGQDLAAVLADALARDRKLPVDAVLGWADDLCGALAYLHRLDPPVVHRDVKPANVKLTPDGQLKLVDFGLAQRLAVAGGPTMTVIGGGSRAYQPLEQYGDAPVVDPRADVYAAGATLLHLLTGRAPESAQERFMRRTGPLDVAALRPDVPPAVVEVLAAAMALHPDDRPADAAMLRARLRQAQRPVPPVAGAPAVRPAAWRADAAWLSALIVLSIAAAWLSLLP